MCAPQSVIASYGPVQELGFGNSQTSQYPV